MKLNMGEFPSGQRGQTVNLLSSTSVVRIHLLPPVLKIALNTAFRAFFFDFIKIQEKQLQLTYLKMQLAFIEFKFCFCYDKIRLQSGRSDNVQDYDYANRRKR